MKRRRWMESFQISVKEEKGNERWEKNKNERI
jgi:hypothetical protein